MFRIRILSANIFLYGCKAIFNRLPHIFLLQFANKIFFCSTSVWVAVRFRVGFRLGLGLRVGVRVSVSCGPYFENDCSRKHGMVTVLVTEGGSPDSGSFPVYI